MYLLKTLPDRKKKTNNISELSAKNVVDFPYSSSCDKKKILLSGVVSPTVAPNY